MSNFELNGNITEKLPTSGSLEDLSEYTDADESISAPTEILAEFLSSIMMKDYEKALRYCTLILSYEPNHATAKEFYPLIVEKLEFIKNEEFEYGSSDSSESSSSLSESSSSDHEHKKHSDNDGTTASYSSLEDDAADDDNNDKQFGNVNVSYPSTDIKNGNTFTSTNFTPSLTQEEHKEEKKELTTLTPPTQKILLHPTSNATIRDSSCQLSKSLTYTKNFSYLNQNAININELQSMTTNTNHPNEPNFNNSFLKKIPSKKINSYNLSSRNQKVKRKPERGQNSQT